jgi:hypothetical protein
VNLLGKLAPLASINTFKSLNSDGSSLVPDSVKADARELPNETNFS